MTDYQNFQWDSTEILYNYGGNQFVTPKSKKKLRREILPDLKEGDLAVHRKGKSRSDGGFLENYTVEIVEFNYSASSGKSVSKIRVIQTDRVETVFTTNLSPIGGNISG